MHSVHPTATWQRPISPIWPLEALIFRLLGWGLLGSLFFGAGLLAYRRLAGALLQPLDAPWLAVVGLTAWMLTLLGRMGIQSRLLPPRQLAEETAEEDKKKFTLWASHDQRASRIQVEQARKRRRLSWLAKGCLVAAALCLSLPDTSAAGLIGLWGTVLGGLAAEGWLQRQIGVGFPLGRTLPRVLPQEAPPLPGVGGCPLSRFDLKQADLEDWPEGLLEHLHRIRTPEGTDVRSGWVRVDFASGQRTTAVHIAFCPPFSHRPLLHLQQAAGPPVRLKTTHLYPYGLRIEVKREQIGLDRSAWVLLEFQAQCPAGSEESLSDTAPSKPRAS